MQLVGLELDQFEQPLLLEDSTLKKKPTNKKEFDIWEMKHNKDKIDWYYIDILTFNCNEMKQFLLKRFAHLRRQR